MPGQMTFVRAKNYELNRNALILVISPLESNFERAAAGDGITVLSFRRLLQFPSVIRRCAFKLLAIFRRLTVRSRSSYGMPEVTAVLITQDNSAAFLILRQQLLQIRLDNFCIELKGIQWKNNSRPINTASGLCN